MAAKLDGFELPVFHLIKRIYIFDEHYIDELVVSIATSYDHDELTTIMESFPDHEANTDENLDEQDYYILWVVESEEQAMEYLLSMLPVTEPIRSIHLLNCYDLMEVLTIYKEGKYVHDWDRFYSPFMDKFWNVVMKLPNAPSRSEIEDYWDWMGK